MNPKLARALHAATLLVAGSGLVYAWMLYLLEPADEFALWNHPSQGLLQRVHIVAAPLLVVAGGAAWLVLVWPRLTSRSRARRRTGLVLAWSFAPMTLSGYLLQTATGEGERSAWLAAHLASSLIFSVGYVVHLCSSRNDQG